MFFLASLAAEASSSANLALIAHLAFIAFIAALLALDLGVFHRKDHAMGVREALAWTGVWVGVALLFNAAIYFLYEHHILGLGLAVPVLGQPGITSEVSGAAAALQFFTGYIVEKSLALDNIFVIAVVFSSLAVPAALQHRVLFWGILGAIIMRGLMIFVGAHMVESFWWTSLLFGGILILTAAKMAFIKSDHTDPAATPLVRLVKRIIPLSDRYEGRKFLTRIDGRLFATPLLLALIVVEFTDVIFAIDSIPAIFAITADPFIVFTSNILAILGLRSLYFCLSALIGNLRFLKPALVIILLFVGIKMCLVHTEFHVPTLVSISVILGTLTLGIVASLIWPAKKVPLIPTPSIE